MMISAIKVRKMFSKGYIGFLAYVVSKVKSGSGIEETPVIWEFPNMF